MPKPKNYSNSTANAEIRRLKKTIESMQFCNDYYKSRVSHGLALKILSYGEIWLLRLRKLLLRSKYFSTNYKDPSPIIPNKFNDFSRAKIAIFIHVFYSDVMDEMIEYLSNLSHLNCQVIVNVINKSDSSSIKSRLNKIFPDRVKILNLPNKGRDMGSFLHFINEFDVTSFDYILKLHTKKSLRIGEQEGSSWRFAQFNSLMGSKRRVEEIINSLTSDRIGIVGTEELHMRFNLRQENYSSFKRLTSKLKISRTPFEYFAGGMFWIKPEVVQSLKGRVLFSDFCDEKGHNDGQLEHSLERVFCMLAKSQDLSIQKFPIFVQD